MNYEDIRREYAQHVGTNKAVETAVKRTAALIGLTLRPVRQIATPIDSLAGELDLRSF